MGLPLGGRARPPCREFLPKIQLDPDRFIDLRSRAHTIQILDKRRPGGDVDATSAEQQQRPGEIGIRNRKSFADQVWLPCKLGGGNGYALADTLPGARLRGVIGVPERWKQERLVHLGADEAEPLLQAITILVAVRRRQAFLRAKVGDVLENRRILGQLLAVFKQDRKSTRLNSS